MSAVSTLDLSETLEQVRPDDQAVPRELTIVVDIQRIFRVWLFVVLALVVLGATAHVITYHVLQSPQHYLARVMNRFDLGYEPSLPSWYSSCAMVAASLMLFMISMAKANSRDRFVRHWFVLAVGFLLMAIDEGVRFHEMVNRAMVLLKLNGHGLLFFPWVIPACTIVALIGLSYLRFLWALEPRSRTLFLVSGAIFVAGAVGIDGIGGVFIETHGMDSIHHTITQTIEELFEMVGIVVFNYALFDYISRRIGSIHIQVPPVTATN